MAAGIGVKIMGAIDIIAALILIFHPFILVQVLAVALIIKGIMSYL